MIKILISCGAGMSSSFLAQKLQNACVEKGLDQEYSFDFYPIHMAGDEAVTKLKEYDICMVCPHLRLFVDALCKKHNVTTPIYVLPPRMYGTMFLDQVITDAKDIVEGFKQDHMNPWHFPGEDNPLKIRRRFAYRNQDQDKG